MGKQMKYVVSDKFADTLIPHYITIILGGIMFPSELMLQFISI